MSSVTGSTKAPLDAGAAAHPETPDSFWSGSAEHPPTASLVDRIAGDVVLRHAPGRRILDLGHGAPSITAWLAGRAATLQIVPREALVQDEAPALPFADASLDLVFSIRTLPHLGTTLDASIARTIQTLAEVGRVLAPWGTGLLQIDNPRSFWGLYHGVRDVLAEQRMHATDEGWTRFDTPRQFARMLPPSLDLVRTHGLAVFVSVWRGLKIPLLGRWVEAAEWRARDEPMLRHFGRHLLMEVRRLPSP